MRRIRQLRGWEPNQFKLALAIEDGALVLRGVTPLALQEGRYRVQVTLEEAKNSGSGEDRLVRGGRSLRVRHRTRDRQS